MADDCPTCRLFDEIIRRRIRDPAVGAAERIDDLLRRELIAGITPADLALMGVPYGGALVKGSKVGRAVAREGRNIKKGVSAAAKLSRKNMRTALKQVNAKARKKSGALKKGWTQSRIMKTAHKIAKKL